MLPVVFPAVCPAFVLEPVPFEALPSVVPEFIVPSDATPGVLLVPELSLPSELPVPDEEPPFPVPEVPLEEPFVFPLLIPFESPVSLIFCSYTILSIVNFITYCLIILSLHPAGAVSLDKAFNLRYCNAVKIALNRVL